MLLSCQDVLQKIQTPFIWAALDVGSKHIGWAYSDSMWIVASPGGMIHAKNMLRTTEVLIQHMETYHIKGFVLGLPLHDRDDDDEYRSSKQSMSKQAIVVQKFASLLMDGFHKHKLDPVLTLYDERFSSQKADDFMVHELGLSVKKQKQKQDTLAATFILQDFLMFLIENQIS